MSLKEHLIKVPIREKAGPTSASRFDYQKDWSICKLIEYHKIKSDYVIIFDWHEDLVIMDSESNPQRIEFYQIKGKKSGNWKVSDLIRSETGKDGKVLLSIIGKLYDCKSKFDFGTSSLNFVSNARFQVDLEVTLPSSLTKDDICIIELKSEEKAKIKNKIKTEHSLSIDPIYEDITFLRVIDLSLDGSKEHTQGKISEFLNSIFPNKNFNIPNVYRMLFDEVKRRSGYSKDNITYEDLLSNKAIGKSQFEQIMEATGINKNYDEIWNRLDVKLQNDGLSFQATKNLKQAWKKLELERMNPNNDYLYKLIDTLKAIANESESNGTLNNLKLIECVESIYNTFNKTVVIPVSYDLNFIKAIILSEIYD